MGNYSNGISLNIFGESSNKDETKSNSKNIPIPGGLSERPSGAPKDVSVSSSKTDIQVKVYNDALDALQKSFKESAILIDNMKQLQSQIESAGVKDDETQKQMDYLESAIDNAILEACENGPIYEAVDRSDKDSIKAIVKALRPKMKEAVKENGGSYYNANMVGRTIVSAIGIIGVTASSAALPMGAASIATNASTGAAAGVAASKGLTGGGAWSKRLWQVLGVVNIETGNISSLMNKLNEEFSSDLGDYKLLAVKTVGGLHDLFIKKFGWKNSKKSYFIIVDKKIPADIKTLQKDVDAALKASDKNEAKTESYVYEEMEENSNMNELYREYLVNFAENGVDGQPLSAEAFSEAVSSFEENGSLDSFTEGKYTQYKKAMSDAGYEKDTMPNKDFRSNYKQIKHHIDELYEVLKSTGKISYRGKDLNDDAVTKTNKKGKVKPIAKYKFRGIMFAAMQMFDKIDADEGEAVPKMSTEVAIKELNAAGLTISKDDLNDIRQKMEDIANDKKNKAVTRAFYDDLAKRFKQSGYAMESADMEDVIDHLNDFLSENV